MCMADEYGKMLYVLFDKLIKVLFIIPPVVQVKKKSFFSRDSNSWLELRDKKWNVKKIIVVKEAILLHDYSLCSGLTGTSCSFHQCTFVNYFGTRQSISTSFFLAGTVKFPAYFCTRRSGNGSWNIRKNILWLETVCSYDRWDTS